MAEIDKGTSGTAGKKSDKSKHKSKPKKSTSKDTAEETGIVINDELTCSKCTSVFVEEDDKLLECERCDGWFCISCVEMEPAVYAVIGQNKNLHWFCKECEKPALTAVKSDKEIEEKCAAYMSNVTERIVVIEEKIEEKADKSVVESLQGRVIELEKRVKESSSEVQPNTVHQTIVEQREREYRVRSLIIQNLPESEKSDPEEVISEDTESVKDILSAIGITEEVEIESCTRMGDKGDEKVRLIKISVSTVESKWDIIKRARKLKENTKYKEVYISPDLTRLQRTEQFELREELRLRKGRGEKDIFIRGRRIIQAKDKALRFRGGAPGEAKK